MEAQERASVLGPLLLWSVLTLAVAALFPLYLVLANFEGAQPWVEQAELWCLVALGLGALGIRGATWFRGRIPRRLMGVLLLGSVLAVSSAAAWVEYVHVRSSDLSPYTRLGPGDTAPEIEATDHRGIPFKLSAWSGPAVLVFYRGQWCPFCYRELQSLKRIEPSLRAAGGVILAVSMESSEDQLAPWQRDTADPHEAFPEGMRFIADPNGEVIERYGLTAVTHGREVARPMIFVVSPGGRISWRSDTPSWRHRAPAEEVLERALAKESP